MVSALSRKLSSRFDDEIRFFKGWIDGPKAVGSIVPTSQTTARRLASLIDTRSERPVLELGPGTGVVTKAILQRGTQPNRLVCVEFSEDFVAHLKQSYPGVRVIAGDAFDLDETLGHDRDTVFDSAVSGIPLLNFPVSKRVAYIENVLKRLPAGRPVVQITYGPRSPIPEGQGDYTVEKLDFVVRNIPPAHLWVYRRPA